MAHGIDACSAISAQESFCSVCVRADAPVIARHSRPESRPNDFLSERKEGAAQTELHYPITQNRLFRTRHGTRFLAIPTGQASTPALYPRPTDTAAQIRAMREYARRGWSLVRQIKEAGSGA